MHLPDHLEHQELVEVRVQQRPDRRVDSKRMIIDAGCDIDCHYANLRSQSGGDKGARPPEGGNPAGHECDGGPRRPARRSLGLEWDCSSPASSTSSVRPSGSRPSSCWRTPAARLSCRAQTCCGQPAYNSGDRATAKDLAHQAIDAFEDCDYVVAPSGSCGGMLATHYPELFAGEPDMAAKAERFRRQDA